MPTPRRRRAVRWPFPAPASISWLAVDIVDLDHQLLDESQEQTAVQQWLMTNSWRYGFILRYPTAKTETTGIIYEPWHYRYVGQEAAAEIYQQGVCLEEYVAAKYGA